LQPLLSSNVPHNALSDKTIYITINREGGRGGVGEKKTIITMTTWQVEEEYGRRR
jgi:hypothetical protein